MICNRNINKKATVNSSSSFNTNSKTATLATFIQTCFRLQLRRPKLCPDRCQKKHQGSGQCFHVSPPSLFSMQLYQEKQIQELLMQRYSHIVDSMSKKLAHVTTLSYLSTFAFYVERRNSHFFFFSQLQKRNKLLQFAGDTVFYFFSFFCGWYSHCNEHLCSYYEFKKFSSFCPPRISSLFSSVFCPCNNKMKQ